MGVLLQYFAAISCELFEEQIKNAKFTRLIVLQRHWERFLPAQLWVSIYVWNVYEFLREVRV